jgi:subtilisin-like proprotein convertase family protein
VTVDHVNAGTGLQSLTLVGVPVNAVVNIPAFAPGTINPVTVTFTTPNPGQAVDFTLRAASTFHAAFIRVRCMQTCTPSTTVTEGNLFPGGVVSFGVAGGPGTVTVDHVNAGTGLQSLTVVGVPTNAIVTIPAFMPGTINPVVVTFTVINPALPVDFTLRAASQFHAANIRAQCGTVTPTPTPTPVGTPTPTPTPVASPTPTPTPGTCPTFTNPMPILVPAGAPATTSGPASPYPSTINASGLGGTVTKVTVTLNNFNHTFPDDVDVLLVGPGGQSVILMSDAGGALDVTNVNLTFDDAAAAMLPDSTQIVSGTYRPTNFLAGDTFVAPAPAGPYGTMLSVFNGTAPNGAYSLYVVDDLGGDIGNFNGGWTLNVTTTSCGGTTPTPTPVASPTPTPVASPTPTPGGTPTPTPTPGNCPTTITQSSSQTITPNNTVACFNAAGNFTRDNQFWRAFNLASFGIGAGQSYTVTSVSFGIEVAATNPAGGTQPITVNLYANNGAAFPGGTRTLIGTATVQVADQTGTILSVPIAAVAPAGTTQLVMELNAPDRMTTGGRFFPGSNTAAETGPSYISSTACSIATPTTYAGIGFPNVRLVFNVMGSCAGNAPITLKSNSSDVSALNPVVSSWFTDEATKVDPLKNFGLEKSGTSGDALMTYQPK